MSLTLAIALCWSLLVKPIFCLAFSEVREEKGTEKFVSVVTAAADDIKETITVEKEMTEVASVQLQPIIQHPTTPRNDDWFMLLDVVPRESSYIPSGTAEMRYLNFWT